MKNRDCELSLRSLVQRLIGYRTFIALTLHYRGFRTLLKILFYLQNSQVTNISILTLFLKSPFPLPLGRSTYQKKKKHSYFVSHQRMSYFLYAIVKKYGCLWMYK
jgi:hypothetical protein